MGEARASGAARQRGRRLLLFAGVFAAVAVRLPLLGRESVDIPATFGPWIDFMIANGPARSFAYDFYNYNPPYPYLLSAAVALAGHAPALLLIKSIPVAFDFAAAYFVYKCVALKYGESNRVPILAAVATLLAPTVVMNAAWWGQSDSIYTTFLLASLYFLLAGRQMPAFAAFGTAFAVKAQGAFLAPLFFWLGARRVVDLRYSAFAAVAVFAALVPAWVAGRPLTDLLFVYFRQAGYTAELSNHAPNPYEWIPNDYFAWWPVGLAVTAALILVVRQCVKRGSAALTRGTIVHLALFSTVLLPFFLPKMHDRFFFAADVLAIVFAFYRPRYWYAPIALAVVSGSTYPQFVLGVTTIPTPVAAFGMLLLLLALSRGLLESLGYRVRLRAAFDRMRHRAKVRTAAPALALPLAFAALFTAFHLEGRFGRGLADDGASAATLARAANRSPEHGLAAFSRRSLDPEGRVVYETAAGGSVAGDLVLAGVIGHFRDDLGAQVAAARTLMVSLFFGAALLAFLSLRRLLPSGVPGSSRIALAATLFAFGSTAAGFADAVAVEAAPELFGVFLAFHGMAVFRDEGRFPQLALKCAAALALGWQAAVMVFPFAALGLAGSFGFGRSDGRGNDRPLASGGRRRSLRDLVRSPYSMLAAGAAAFVLLPGLLSFGSPPDSDTPADAAAEGYEVSAGAADFGSFASAEFAKIGRSFLPYPLAASSARQDASGSLRGAGGAAALAGVLLAAGCLIGAARSDRRLLFLPLALAGFGSFAAFARGAVGGAPGPAVFESLSIVAIPLVAWALVFEAASRRFGRSAPQWAAALGFAFFVLAVPLGARRGSARAPEARQAVMQSARQSVTEGRDDFSRIRRVLRRRVEETVFLPPVPVGGRNLEGARASFYLAGSVLVEAPAPRASAEFAISEEAEAAEGLLTPRNREAFLYHRAAYDGELDGLIEAAGAPRARSEFDVHLGGGRLLFVKDDCRPEHLEGTFIAHLVPEDPDDLSPWRKPYGFENLSFLFAERAYATGARCAAGVRVPEYPIRSAAVGRSFRQPDGSYERVWREEFAPGVAARPPGGGP